MEETPTPIIPSAMPEPLCMEALSIAYVRAVAAKARVNIQRSENDFGSDLSFVKVIERNGRYTDSPDRPLSCQIKSSKLWEVQEDMLAYDLKAKNYNDLVYSCTRFLVLLCLPPDFDNWILQDEEQLCIRKCGYYWYPTDRVETRNTETKRIFIPKRQIFTPDALTLLINRIQLEGRL